MTLKEAIRHCDDKTNSTACGQDHRQLGHWLRELRLIRTAVVVAAAVIVVSNAIKARRKDK